MSNVIQFPKSTNSTKKEANAMNKQYSDRSRGPIRFDKLRPGSLYRIHAEPSRGIYRSKDKSIYRRDPAYFYSTDVNDPNRSIVLMPEDLVVPVGEDRPNYSQKRKIA